MPDFSIEDLDISPDEFINACSSREIDELIEILKEDGYISEEVLIETEGTHDHIMFIKALIKLSESRLRLTNEEEEIIKKIANRL